MLNENCPQCTVVNVDPLDIPESTWNCSPCEEKWKPKKWETKSLENIVLNKNVKIENYIPFSTIENNRSEINNPTNIKKTLFTREKTTTGFFNII